MSETWNTRRKALEDDYFLKMNQAALERISERQEDKPRPSPITGEPMEQKTVMGVVIDQCPTSHGIWLDAGELEEILKASAKQEDETGKNLLSEFFATITGK